MRKQQPRETEAALVIRSARPEKIAAEIAKLDAVGGYRLERGETQKIRDIYFDTPDRVLEKQRLGLRIRQVNDKRLITLKGPGRQGGWGKTRLEIEAAWSRKALQRVLRELRARGIRVRVGNAEFESDDPLETIEELGFQVIQDRQTNRLIRNVLKKNVTSKTVVAELAIDSVSYHFGKQIVCLHEIEIESKTKNGKAAGLATLLENLIEMYQPALQEWKSKLATGRALGELSKNSVFRKLIGRGGNLKPAALDAIGKHLAT
ncbi:MAG: CYTH domain-containing protein [Chloroflexi bacterium]|nr:CYTH domain-containing protein [Chloroflexota bacterium]